jgi:hypothetical protein
VNEDTTSSATLIKFTWEDGTSDGGSPVIDYQVDYELLDGSYVELDSAITSQEYTTSITLTEGRTYKFKVRSRNSVGLSPYSTVLEVLAA